MNILINFTPGPPTGAFGFLEVKVVDAGGNTPKQMITKDAVQSQAVAKPDGTYDLTVSFTGLAVGPYTVTATPLNGSGQVIGPSKSGSGIVPLSEPGVSWVPVINSIN